MPDEDEPQFDLVPPPENPEDEEEISEEEQKSRLAEAGGQIKEQVFRKARQAATKMVARAAGWIFRAIIIPIVSFIIANIWWVLLALAILGVAFGIIAWIYSGRSGSKPGAYINIGNPAHQQLVNHLLTLTGNSQAINNELRQRHEEIKKDIDATINNLAKQKTSRAEELRTQFITLRAQIDQLLLAGSNSQQINNILQNINSVLVKIKELWLAESQKLAQEILSPKYKDKIQFTTKAKDDIEMMAKGEFIIRLGKADGKDGGDGDYSAPQVLSPRVLNGIKYLADNNLKITVSCLIGTHKKYVHGKGSSIPDHWYGAAVDIRASGEEQRKLIAALLKAPGELKPNNIYGNLPDSAFGKPYKYLGGHLNHLHLDYYGTKK